MKGRSYVYSIREDRIPDFYPDWLFGDNIDRYPKYLLKFFAAKDFSEFFVLGGHQVACLMDTYKRSITHLRIAILPTASLLRRQCSMKEPPLFRTDLKAYSSSVNLQVTLTR